MPIRNSRPAFLLIVILAVVLTGCKGEERTAAPLVEGQPAPLFSLTDQQGKTWSLEDLKGKVVVVNFWASWCPPCRLEMPSLYGLAAQMHDVQDFVILTILFRDNPERALRYLEENGMSLTVLEDEDLTVSRTYRVTGVPETIIIDKQGIVREKMVGGVRFESPSMLAFIQSLISETP